VWKEWIEWGTCDTTCGGGIQSRSRGCQGPFYNGSQCQGNNTQYQSCNDQECPGNLPLKVMVKVISEIIIYWYPIVVDKINTYFVYFFARY
jgi:hypothetical protein